MLSYPDYERSIINIISSVMNYYRQHFEYPTLTCLDKHLCKHYKNIVLVVLGGMGTDMILHNLPEDNFFRKFFVQNITSVFPSATAAAMTSYCTGVSPNEHAWLGWSLFFKEFCRTVDIYTNLDTYTKQTAAISSVAEFVMPYDTIYKSIKSSTIGRVQPFTIAPSKIQIAEKGNLHKVTDRFDRVCDLIEKIGDTKQHTFTYVQWNNPDETAQRTGCYSDETRNILLEISSMLEKTFNKLTDTLLIVSADHGMIDISDEILIDRIPEINDCLYMPPFVESRAMSFFVKQDRKTDFERNFNNMFGQDFLLLSRKDIFSKNLLGLGKTHPKTYDFVGDYMACAISDRNLRYRTLNTKPKSMNLANYGGLTEQEMTVPLIIAPSPKSKDFFKKKLI